MEGIGISIIQRAVEKDKKEQYTMALTLYQEGIQVLLESMKEMEDPTRKKHFRARTTDYIERAEKIKSLIAEKKSKGQYRETLKIENGAVGHGYSSVFGRFLDPSVTEIRIEEPYVRAGHQCQNLVRFCELAVQKCQALSKIILTTTSDPNDKIGQMSRLDELKKSLANRSVTLDIRLSDSLHDRQITLSNGWVIKIGRGLDYFRPPEGKFVLGYSDLELRPCRETTVDIFHLSHLQDNMK